ncbi:MAG TPA: SWIM zinc finger family protein [Candidatus Wallbacteria bacterium]|nr:SWIM zinc finger family protein [Candidatus Wallbacteria bacterium]
MPFYDRYYWGYKSYKPDKDATARALEKLRKKGRDAAPVVIAGKIISSSWWGIKWCQNLESYSDFYNRLERGRSYVRNGAVIDLKILPGRIDALVQGSNKDPYEVEISIKPVKRETWKAMAAECAGKIHSLGELLEGRIPGELSTLFTARDRGIFPSPREIDFECSCPDFAYMCKHVAAVLYGVGARLDNDPSLFFTLRKADIADIISGAVARKSEDMLKKAGARSGRVISEGDLAETFGIDIDGFDSGPAAAAALPPEAELTPEKRDGKEDKIIFEESQAEPQKSAAKLILKCAQRKAAAKLGREPYEKPRLKERPLIERIKSLLVDIENVSSVEELEALSGVLTKLSKITAKKIELLKALDEIKAF